MAVVKNEPSETVVENFGLHDQIEIDGREFHVHTGTLIENQRVISEVFEKGMFLISREHEISVRNDNKNVDYDFLNHITETFHQSVIDELEALYQIESKLERYRHAKSHYYLGVLFLKRNLYEESIRQFKIAYEQDNTYIRALLGLGISYLKSRQYQAALKTFGHAREMNEKYPDFINYHGLAYLFLGDYDHSTTLFKEAIELNPHYVEAQLNLGVALYKSALEGVKDARAVAVPARVSIYLKQVRDLKKYRVPHWQREFNQILELLRDNNHSVIIPELEQFMLKLVDLTADQEKIYEFYLRFLFGGKELPTETIVQYEQFFFANREEQSHYPDFWNDVGTFNLIKSRGLYLKAISEFEKALSLSPDFDDAQQNLDSIRSHAKGFLILLRAILK